ncbi:MAG: hypothetical protein HFH48_00185 [Lachnospiraceae bacterium]|nr:hypothetical protein [Lachnospiraceae bacterium]
MAIESNWENCKSQNIMEDLVNIHEHTKVSAPKNFIPMYPAWARNYADKFGMVEGKDFVVSESYVEVKR